jgi:hypothetical protein
MPLALCHQLLKKIERAHDETTTKAAEKANAMGETTLQQLVMTLTFFGFKVF